MAERNVGQYRLTKLISAMDHSVGAGHYVPVGIQYHVELVGWGRQ